MSLSDWITLAGVLVSGAAIAIPLIVAIVGQRRRFKAQIGYKVDAFAAVSQLTLNELVRGGQLNTLAPDLQASLAGSLREAFEEFSEALSSAASWFEKRVGDQRPPGRSTAEMLEDWHLLLGQLRVRLGIDLSNPETLGGVAQNALGTAVIGQLVLGLCRNRQQAMDLLEASSVGGGPADAIRMFATSLLESERRTAAA